MEKSYSKGWLSARFETSLFPVQLLYTTHIENADSLSDWRPLFLFYTVAINNSYRKTASSLSDWRPLFIFYTVAICNSYRKGSLSVRLEASLSLSLSSICCIQVLKRRHPLCQIRSFSLSYLAAIFKYYREGALAARLEASLLPI